MPPHAPLLALGDEEEWLPLQLEDGWQDSRYFRLLTPPNTRWKFRFSPRPSEAPSVQGAAGFPQAESWDDIAVPGCWECAGHYGQPIYTNFQYPFKVFAFPIPACEVPSWDRLLCTETIVRVLRITLLCTASSGLYHALKYLLPKISSAL